MTVSSLRMVLFYAGLFCAALAGYAFWQTPERALAAAMAYVAIICVRLVTA